MTTYQLLNRKCQKALALSNISERIYLRVSCQHFIFHLFILILNIVISCGVYAAVLCLIVYSCSKKKQFVLLPTKWNTSTAALFHKLHILSLYQLNDYQVGCFMYRCMNALLPNDFCHMFVKNSDFHSYATRNRDTVHITTCRHSIRFFCPKLGLWNCLPLNIRNSQSFLFIQTTF